MSNTAGETAGITQDVGQDPTVGNTSVHRDASQPSPSSALASPPLSPAPDFCTMCGQEIFCETCGNPTDFGCFLEVDDQDTIMSDANPIFVDVEGQPATRQSKLPPAQHDKVQCATAGDKHLNSNNSSST